MQNAILVPQPVEDRLSAPNIEHDAEEDAEEQREPQPEPFGGRSAICKMTADPAPILCRHKNDETSQHGRDAVGVLLGLGDKNGI